MNKTSSLGLEALPEHPARFFSLFPLFTVVDSMDIRCYRSGLGPKREKREKTVFLFFFCVVHGAFQALIYAKERRSN